MKHWEAPKEWTPTVDFQMVCYPCIPRKLYLLDSPHLDTETASEPLFCSAWQPANMNYDIWSSKPKPYSRALPRGSAQKGKDEEIEIDLLCDYTVSVAFCA